MYNIIFLHIPKTAGTTFKQIIQRNYARNVRFGLDGEEKYMTGQKFRNLSYEERNNIKLLGGHINFGMHNSFNDKNNVKYITFLRDPIQREISYYNYVLRIKQHVHHREVIEKKMTLEDYITSDMHKMLLNSQTKQIVGMQGGLQSESVIFSGNILELAKNNINEHFIFSGITEQFDKGIILLYKILNWKFPLYYRSLNIAPNNLKYSKISDKTMQLIADQNQLDIQLYEYVKNAFIKEIEHNKDYINRHMHLLKMFNYLYNFYNKIHKN
ncbi:sulfotransferase family protein [Rhodocytophaga rosea]|uniref:Sulfotransferase family protein n=1 Tax=Rhodocytophaga rosea TaxID=2704465 RepID=A0A6C0GQ64_9BACT|nr:sulfotransferase family 2 domain-containing protein [Rhodocytophaga rosea]QHT70199.1 sulfotransferase family protein [Rhodocytophaga rosea]